jgi:hypothetical protein
MEAYGMYFFFGQKKSLLFCRVRNHLWTVLPATVRLPFIPSDPQIYSNASVFTRLWAPDKALPSFMRSLRNKKVSLTTSAMPDTLLYATILSYGRNQWQKDEY